MTIDALAQRLDRAVADAVAVAQPAEPTALAEAYDIQHAGIALRLARGEVVVGAKLGFTSRAKMVQMGVDEIIVGQLTDRMEYADGARVDRARFIHPRIEPEVAYRLRRDVDLSGVDDEDIIAAIDAIAPALEIIDSRYVAFRFNLTDVIADNTSAAGFVIGAWREFDGADEERTVTLFRDDEPVESGTTADILGGPLLALRELMPLARRYGIPLRAGDVVLAGAATAAVPFVAGRYHAEVAGLGQVSATAHDG